MKRRVSIKEMTKNIYMMFQVQMHHILRNKIALVIFLGLVILPSFYAWFNIYANMDPYANTSNLEVAVTSLDKGSTIDVMEINIGNDIVDNLAENNDIGWRFVTEEVALEGVKSGRFYAAIIIPEDFSDRLTGITRGNTQKGEIKYYVNEKANAISPKVTNAGLTELEREIDTTFVRTVSEVTLNALKILDDRYDRYKPNLMSFLDTMDMATANMDLFISQLDYFYKTTDALDAVITNTQDALPQVNVGIENAMGLVQEGQNSLREAKISLSNMRDIITTEVNTLPVMAGSINRDIYRIASLNNDAFDTISDRLDPIKDKAQSMKRTVNNIRRSVERLNDLLPIRLKGLDRFAAKLAYVEGVCQDTIDIIDETQDNLADAEENVESIKDTLRDAGDRLVEATNDAVNEYNNTASIEFGSLNDQMNKTLDQADKTLLSLSDALPSINRVLASAYDAGQQGRETVAELQNVLRETQGVLERTTKNMRDFTDDEKTEEALKIIREDARKQSDFLSSPVEIKHRAIYPTPNYGSAMAPFYTILACWVGCLLLASIVGPINQKGLLYYPQASLLEMYVSRLGLYMVMAGLQGLILALGDLIFLDIYCIHSILFVLYTMFVSMVFSIFVFSLVFVFRNVGKAVAIVLLVLQIAASGGTFPIEMTPPFFREIHPFLPFTYAIGGMRELQMGIYWPNFLSDLFRLSLIPILSVLLVALLGPKLIRAMDGLERDMEKSGLY